LEIASELGDEVVSSRWVLDHIDRPDDLLRVPSHAHLAVRVARLDKVEQLLVAGGVESFMRDASICSDSY
jgi:hypothetical protein